MDNDVVSAKLELLARSIERVQKRRLGSAAELANDPDTQDIVVLNLQRAVHWNIVYSIATEGITDFQRFGGAIQALMRKPE